MIRQDAVVAWLLRGDPAIRWQVQRDLLRRPQRAWLAEQRRVALEGWGARLLARQDSTGRWTPRFYGQKWISTTYSMLLLRQMGLPQRDPRARGACGVLLDEGLWRDGGINPTTSRGR